MQFKYAFSYVFRPSSSTSCEEPLMEVVFKNRKKNMQKKAILYNFCPRGKKSA